MPCCDASCRYVAASAGSVCRAAADGCDVAETCPGATAECPTDRVAYPGVACSSSAGHAGRCFAGRCESQAQTCAVEHTGGSSAAAAFALDATSSTCAALNDDCSGYLWCTRAGGAATDCTPARETASYSTVATPNGLACLHASDPLRTRRGFCHEGSCATAEALAGVWLGS